MNTEPTLSRRPARRFWGWGLADASLDAREQSIVRAMLWSVGATFEDRPVPQLGDFSLPAPKIAPPPSLASQFSALPLDRLNHCGGKSYADLARMWMRRPPATPDWVAFPENEQAVVDILDWAQLYMEIKSSPPKQIYQKEVGTFLGRVDDLRPEIAVFFDDAELRMYDKIVPMFEEELRARFLEPPEVLRIARELFGISGGAAGRSIIFIMNAKDSIITNTERVLAGYFRRIT